MPLLVSALTMLSTESYGQRYSCINKTKDNHDGHWGNGDIGRPHGCIRQIHKKVATVNVSYDAMTTILNVDFPANSLGGTVEVFKNGSRIGAMTSGAGTTFGCVLMDYGVGQYSVIVTHGNTVLYSKNIEVK